MNTTQSVNEIGKAVNAAIQAAGVESVSVLAVDGRLYLTASSHRVDALRQAIALAKPVLLGSGRKVSRISRNGHKLFRITDGASLRACFQLELSAEETTRIVLGRQGGSDSFRA